MGGRGDASGLRRGLAAQGVGFQKGIQKGSDCQARGGSPGRLEQVSEADGCAPEPSLRGVGGGRGGGERLGDTLLGVGGPHAQALIPGTCERELVFKRSKLGGIQLRVQGRDHLGSFR